MSQYITLSHIEVQDANCIAGITYGFPAITQFLGFVHALSRKLQESKGVSLDACAIVCHDYQLHTYKSDKYSDYYFSQTKNPSAGRYQSATKGTPPPIIEEGKMHMDISLVIECHGFNGNDGDTKAFQKYIENLALRHRLAGGRVIKIRETVLETIIDQKGFKKVRRRLIPGFVLKDRSEYLSTHLESLQKEDQDTQMLDVWLDFCAIKYKAEPLLEDGEELSEKTNAQWNSIPKPNKGYLIPLAVGYQAISKVYEAGEVANTRDPTTPFCFVENIYGIGEWLSPHRIENLEELLWRYEYKDNKYYLCTQKIEANNNDEVDTDDIDQYIFN